MDLEPPEAYGDMAVAGRTMLRQRNRLLYYMRLIEYEAPKPVGESAERIPFNTVQQLWPNLERVRLLGNLSFHLHPKSPSSFVRHPIEAKSIPRQQNV